MNSKEFRAWRTSIAPTWLHTQPLVLHCPRVTTRPGCLSRSLVRLTPLQVQLGSSQPVSLSDAQSDMQPGVTCSTGPAFSPLALLALPFLLAPHLCRSGPVNWACLLTRILAGPGVGCMPLFVAFRRQGLGTSDSRVGLGAEF